MNREICGFKFGELTLDRLAILQSVQGVADGVAGLKLVMAVYALTDEEAELNWDLEELRNLAAKFGRAPAALAGEFEKMFLCDMESINENEVQTEEAALADLDEELNG